MATKSSHSPSRARRKANGARVRPSTAGGKKRNRPSSSRSSSRPAVAPPTPPVTAAPPRLAVDGAQVAESLTKRAVEVRRIPIAERFYDCPRCANNHAVEAKRLTRPLEGFTHFAICPNLGEPILLVVLGA
jgi:hypothetical protein